MIYDGAYTQYQLQKRSRLRQRVRAYYLAAASQLVIGRTLDLGCGVGELLRILPAGSKGLEVNPETVSHCRQNGLNVELYEPLKDQYQLSFIPPLAFETLILSHVLEHLEDPVNILATLFLSARRIGIRRVVLIVPGRKGFQYDPTHLTHIDFDFIQRHRLEKSAGFFLTTKRYFPLNVQWIERVFTFHELQLVFDQEIK